MTKEKLQWHPGFSAALRMTFADEMKYLDLQEEYMLSKKPPQIDVLILKKAKNITIQKRIGKLFRGHNIIEYKSPDDYLSLNDFYKVYGYTCFYQSNTELIKEIDPSDLTITFACNHYPREMFRHITEVRGITVKPLGKGIYHLDGDPIPMQFLHIPKLDQTENYWIQTLRTDLKVGTEIRTLMSNYTKNRNSKDCSAVMNLVTRANWKQMEEEKKMCDALNELFAEELKEADSHGRSIGKSQGIQLAKKVFRLASRGESYESIAEICGITAENVKEILE